MKIFGGVFLAAVILLPCAALASFSLSSVKLIECSDLAPSEKAKIFFATDDAAARTYHRRIDTIPYDYGNLIASSAQTGQMKLKNNPDAEGGVIALVDSYDPNNLSTLVLKPSAQSGVYVGTLSGHVETEHGWGLIVEHPMNCIIK